MYSLVELAVWGKRSKTYQRLRAWWRQEHKPKHAQMHTIYRQPIVINIMEDRR